MKLAALIVRPLAPGAITLASDSWSEKWRRRPKDSLLWPRFSSTSRCAIALSLVGCRRPVHTSRMDQRFEEQLRIDNQRWRRRSFVIVAGFVGFLVSLYFTSDPDDTLTLAIALVFYFVTVLLIPDRWFGRARPELITDAPRTDGPRPALRSQPPPPPARKRPFR